MSRTSPGQDLGLGSWPARRARLTPEAVAWSFDGADTTYRQVHERTELLAAALRAHGVVRGDRVAYFGGNHPALLETVFAAGRIGAVAVLVNARLAAHEVAYILADSGASVLFHGAEQADVLAQCDAEQSTTLRGTFAVDPDADSSVSPYERFLRTGNGGDAGQETISLDDDCLIMYTSGTTGRPKGAVLTHGNLFFNDVNVLIETDIRADETCLAAAPLFHIAGLNGLVLPVFLKGGRTVILRGFRPEETLDVLQRERITCMFGVPAMLDGLSQQAGFAAADLTALRTLIVGGAPVPGRILRQFTAHGIEISQGYGLTETSPAVLKLAAADAERKIGSAGKPQFLVDARVADASGKDIAPGGTGEILTRGPNVFDRYWNRSADTEAAFSDGWFRTGDLATVDEEGYVSLRDRSKDMYISGGENIYPAEVENALLDVPGVAEAAVVGVPDERWGEVGRAYVVSAAGSLLEPAAVLAGLAGRLARYKIPKAVEVVESLPRTSTGKLRKHVLREAAATPKESVS